MKKVLSIVLCCVLLLLPVATLAGPAQILREKAFVLHPEWRPAEEAVTGEWFLVAIEIEGFRLNPEMLGMSITLRLNGDGTALTTINGAEDPCTWVIEGDQFTLTESNGSATLFDVTPDRLIHAEIDGSFIFSRNPEDAPGPFVLPPQVQVETTDSLLGKWGHAFMVDPATGAIIPQALLDYDVQLTLSSTSALFEMLGMQEEHPWQVQDGTLVIQMGDVPVTTTLHEGELLRLDFNEETQLYFTKLAE